MVGRFLPSDKKRKLIEKTSSVSNPAYGSPPNERQIEEYIRKGIINVDKPPGPTSHEVVSWVKKILDLKRAGHAGTLVFLRKIVGNSEIPK